MNANLFCHLCIKSFEKLFFVIFMYSSSRLINDSLSCVFLTAFLSSSFDLWPISMTNYSTLVVNSKNLGLSLSCSLLICDSVFSLMALQKLKLTSRSLISLSTISSPPVSSGASFLSLTIICLYWIQCILL